MVRVTALGTDERGHPVAVDDLDQHLVCLGSTGSGKTYTVKRLLQQAVLDGHRAVAFDNQGDFGAFLLPPTKPKRGEFANPFTAHRWNHAVAKRLLIVGEDVGLGAELTGDAEAAARQIADLFDLTPQRSLEAAFAVMKAIEAGADTFDAVADSVGGWLAKRMEMLRAGSFRKLLDAPRLDFDALAGLTTLFLGELADRDQEAFFMARLLSEILPWARAKRQKPLIVTIDECADLLPPVREPATKPAITTLLRQGRKYGVCMVLATQNPGDIDYKALSQVKTWLLGRFATTQDAEKVLDRLRSLAPANYAEIADDLFRLERGWFWLVQPGRVKKLKIGPLLTPHRPLDPHELFKLAHQPQSANS